MTRFALAPALLVSLLAAPAAALTPFAALHRPYAPDLSSLPAGFSHAIEGRFGVVSTRDGVTGQTRTEPVAGLNLRLNWVLDTDAGWRVAVVVDLDAGNLGERRPRMPPGSR